MATFSLETLLKVLKERLDLLREDLAALEEKKRKEREDLAAMEEALRAFQEEFSERCNSLPRAFDLLSYQKFFPMMEERIKGQRKRISLTEEEIERKRREIIAVSLRVKTLERLKDREREKEKALGRREEAKTLDELPNHSKGSFQGTQVCTKVGGRRADES